MRTFRVSGLLLLLIVLSLPASAQAQRSSPNHSVRLEGGLNFLVGVPQGDFSDNVDDPGFGVDFFGALGIGQTPLALGLEGGFLVYGRDTRTVPFSSTVGPAVMVDVTTTNNIAQGHLFLRVQPPEGLVRPYFDALFGFKYLFTQTEVEDEGFDDREPIAQSTNFDDFALSYGLGGGTTIRLFRPQAEDEQPPKFEAIDLRIGLTFLFGSEAEYLREGALEDTNENGQLDEAELDIARSHTTLLEPYLGVSVRF